MICAIGSPSIQKDKSNSYLVCIVSTAKRITLSNDLQSYKQMVQGERTATERERERVVLRNTFLLPL